MDLQLFQDLAPAEREEMLDAQADDVTEENYLQPYTNAEKAQRREEYVALSLEMKQITEEEDEMKQQFKERKAPVKKCMDTVLANLKQGGEYVKGKLYRIIDQEERVVGLYNSKGELVSQRKALPSELNSPTLFGQARTVSLKTGTHDNLQILFTHKNLKKWKRQKKK